MREVKKPVKRDYPTNTTMKGLRNQYGLKRKDIAKHLGLKCNTAKGHSSRVVDAWFSGQTRMPEASLQKLRLVLGETS